MSSFTSEESVLEDPPASSCSSVVKASLELLDANILVKYPMMIYTYDDSAVNNNNICCTECEPEFSDLCCKPRARKKRNLRKPCAMPKRTCKRKAKPKVACKRKVTPKKTCTKRKPKACPKNG